jgi:hypothetical protein
MNKLDRIIADTRELGEARRVTPAPISRRQWEAAVGSRIARRTRPYRLERGTLHVRTATAAWANELSLLSETIVEQLRRHGLRVDALRFRVGPIDAVEPPPRAPAPSPAPPPAPLPAEVDANVARIEHDELRAAIRDAAARSLARHDQR